MVVMVMVEMVWIKIGELQREMLENREIGEENNAQEARQREDLACERGCAPTAHTHTRVIVRRRHTPLRRALLHSVNRSGGGRIGGGGARGRVGLLVRCMLSGAR